MGLSNLSACLFFSFSNLLVLSRCSNHALPCGLCPATHRGIMSWLENRKCAGWLAAGITCAHWACNCTVFEIPGVDGTNIAPDYMQNMFLGWLQYLCGSIMYMLALVVTSGSHEDNLKQIAAFIIKNQNGKGTIHKYRPRLDKLSMFKKERLPQTQRQGR